MQYTSRLHVLSSSLAGLACAAGLLTIAACDDGPHGSIKLDGGLLDAFEVRPGLIVGVSNEGNDAHDGVTLPVETLKRAVEIATDNPAVTDIVLAPGRYSMRQGEAFPYKVPSTVVGISGAPGGGSVLVGTGHEAGLTFESAKIQDLELESFTVAIQASGTVRIKNLKITGSAIGIQASDGTKLRIDSLQIAGFTGPSSCATGLKLDGITEVTITGFTASDVSPAVDADSHTSVKASAIDIANAMITLRPDNVCSTSLLAMEGAGLLLSDSTIDGGFDGRPRSNQAPVGIAMSSPPKLMAPLTMTRTTLRHLNIGMLSSGAVVRIEHSEFTDSFAGFEGDAGTWSLNDLTIARNSLGFSMEGDPVNGAATVTMRNSKVLDNHGIGIVLADSVSADFGTPESPGFNTFTANLPVALDIAGPSGATQIKAVGNTWTPLVQGANEAGQYSATQLLSGPIPSVQGNNFAIATGWSLQL